MLKYLLNYSWAILWGILMLVLMSMPSSDLPSTSYFEGFDKMAHWGFFFVFTVLLLFGATIQSKRRVSKIRTIILTAIIAIFVAFLSEAIQYYLSLGRQADWWDIFADGVGIGMGLFAYLLLYQNRASY